MAVLKPFLLHKVTCDKFSNYCCSLNRIKNWGVKSEDAKPLLFPSRLLLPIKSIDSMEVFAFTENNSRKRINSNSLSSPPPLFGLFFRKGKSEQICAGRDTHPDRHTDTQPVLLPAAGEGSVLLSFVFCLGCPALQAMNSGAALPSFLVDRPHGK